MVVRDPSHDFDTRSPLQLPAQWPVPHEDEPSPTQAFESLGKPNDVLPLGEAADADEDRPITVPRRRGEQLQVDAAVDDVSLALRLGNLQLELAAQVVGDGDQGGGTADDEARRGGDSRVGANVADVAAVGGDDERRSGRDRGGEAGWDQEVRVDDIRAKPPRRTRGLRRETEVTTLAAGARIEHRTLDLMTTIGEGALDLGDERAEIGIARPRVHLRDEQDSQLVA